MQGSLRHSTRRRQYQLCASRLHLSSQEKRGFLMTTRPVSGGPSCCGQLNAGAVQERLQGLAHSRSQVHSFFYVVSVSLFPGFPGVRTCVATSKSNRCDAKPHTSSSQSSLYEAQQLSRTIVSLDCPIPSPCAGSFDATSSPYNYLLPPPYMAPGPSLHAC